MIEFETIAVKKQDKKKIKIMAAHHSTKVYKLISAIVKVITKFKPEIEEELK